MAVKWLQLKKQAIQTQIPRCSRAHQWVMGLRLYLNRWAKMKRCLLSPLRPWSTLSFSANNCTPKVTAKPKSRKHQTSNLSNYSLQTKRMKNQKFLQFPQSLKSILFRLNPRLLQFPPRLRRIPCRPNPRLPHFPPSPRWTHSRQNLKLLRFPPRIQQILSWLPMQQLRQL